MTDTLRALYDDAADERAERLHRALRRRVIDSRMCYECHTEQAFNSPERHADGCLASPAETK